MTCQAWVLLKINEDLQTGKYDGFTSAFYNNENVTRYRTIIKEEYPGRIIEPVDVDVLIQVQAINESKFEADEHIFIECERLVNFFQ